MAMRLIDADALKSYIDCGHYRPATEVCFSELDVVQMLDKQPTIEAEPVRHAYWQDLLGCGYMVCSACYYIPYSIHDKYCLNCGAKMDAGRDTNVHAKQTNECDKPMKGTKKAKALHLLYSQLKNAWICLGHAEKRQNNQDERDNLAQKIDTLEWIIGTVLGKEDDI